MSAAAFAVALLATEMCDERARNKELQKRIEELEEERDFLRQLVRETGKTDA